MIKLLRNYQKREKVNESQALWNKFIANPAHDWIASDSALKRAFELVFEALPPKAVTKFLHKKEVVFIPSQGMLACALGAQEKTDIVLIFPDLIKIFQSASYLNAVAIILHELGHLYFEHNKKVMDLLEAQVEADYFALECGYGHEIQDVLLDSIQSIDTKVRISRLTAEILTREH